MANLVGGENANWRAELQGFQKYTRSGLVLEVNQTATINVQLGVGGLTEEVNVTAEAPLLETSNASRGTVIDNKRIAELPLQSRNPFALSGLWPRELQRPGDLPPAV